MSWYRRGRGRGRADPDLELADPDLELPPYPLHEEAPAVVSGVQQAQPAQLHADGRHHHVHVLVAEQVGDVPCATRGEMWVASQTGSCAPIASPEMLGTCGHVVLPSCTIVPNLLFNLSQ